MEDYDDLLDEDRFSKKKDELEQFQERMKEAKCKFLIFPYVGVNKF